MRNDTFLVFRGLFAEKPERNYKKRHIFSKHILIQTMVGER